MANAEWTVMVLMGANHVKNEADLTAYAAADLTEMGKVGSVPGTLNVVVQIDEQKNGGPRRFLLAKGGKEQSRVMLQDGEGSSGDPDVLEHFLRWAKAEYPADRSMLVIWGHAWRFAFLRDGGDALDFTRMSEVLRDVKGRPIDIVAFDSCNVSWIEAAYQFRDVAKYLVATQFIDPLPGWPYHEILDRIVNPGTIAPKAGAVAVRNVMKVEDLGRAIVSQFVRHYDKPERRYAKTRNDETATVTMTALNLARMDEIGEAIGQLAIALALAVNADSRELSTLRQAFELSQVQTNECAADLVTLCWYLMNYSGRADVREAAAGLGDLLLRPSDPFIVAHARTDLTVAMLNGVSIFAPLLPKPGFDPESLRPLYEALDLSKDTLWAELVYALSEN